jgi:hypothetical protein
MGIVFEAVMGMAGIAEWFVLRVPATTEREYGASAKTILVAVGIDDSEISFNS